MPRPRPRRRSQHAPPPQISARTPRVPRRFKWRSQHASALISAHPSRASPHESIGGSPSGAARARPRDSFQRTPQPQRRALAARKLLLSLQAILGAAAVGGRRRRAKTTQRGARQRTHVAFGA
eukprot:1287950-Pyramimonas_sp.AAC.1